MARSLKGKSWWGVSKRHHISLPVPGAHPLLPFVFMNIDKGRRKQKKASKSCAEAWDASYHFTISRGSGEERKKVPVSGLLRWKKCVWRGSLGWARAEGVAAGFSLERTRRGAEKFFFCLSCLALNSALSIQHSFGVCFLRASRFGCRRSYPCKTQMNEQT